MQEAQALATQQIEAIAMAVSMVLGGSKDKTGVSEASEGRKFEDAAGLASGLAAFMNQG